MATKAIISLHIGQAGIQVGQSLWELYYTEHGINRLGNATNSEKKHELRNVFFDENGVGSYHPRLVYIDLEPSVIDYVRTVSHYNKSSLVCGCEDAANNFGRGYYCTPEWFIEAADSGVRHWMERVDVVQGFMILHSLCGGTGGGFGSMFMTRMQDFFPEVMKFDFQLYPSPNISSTVVEPFNALAAINQLADQIHVGALIDNESIMNINKKLFPDESITHKYLNDVIAMLISGVTSPLRFDGTLNVDLRDLQTNLVPFHRLHAMIISHAPWFSPSVKRPERASTKSITNDVFNHDGWSIMCEPQQGKYIAASLNFRGITATNGINSALTGVRKRFDVEFVDWSPTGFKVGMHSESPRVPTECKIDVGEQSCTMLANHTSLRFVYRRIAKRFDAMFGKRAFLHWYLGAGMDIDEFIDARQYVMELDNNYWDAQKISAVSDDEDEDFMY